MINVAKILKTVGLKGDMKLLFLSDFPEFLGKGTTCSIENKSYIVEYFNLKSKILKLQNIDGIDIAQAFVGKYISATYEETKKRCVLKKDEFLYVDIIGCDMLENDNILGKVDDIEKIADIFYFKTIASKDFKDKLSCAYFYVPYANRYILSVDIKKKIIFTQNVEHIMEAS